MLLNISLGEINPSIIQISINLHKRDQFSWQSTEVKYADVIDGPSARCDTFYVNWVVIHISVSFAISQSFNLSAGYDVFEYELLKGGLVHAGGVEWEFWRDDDGEGSVWGVNKIFKLYF